MKENNFLKRSKILEENQDYLTESVKTISQEFIKVINQKGKLIFAGNGGSAAEAQHMSAEYVGTLVTSNKNMFVEICVDKRRIFKLHFNHSNVFLS